MKKILFISFLFLSFGLSAQSGTLRGVVADKEGGLVEATITFFQDKGKKAICKSDFDGNYSVNLDAGIYDVEFSYLGYKIIKAPKINIEQGKILKYDVKMEEIEGFSEGLSCFRYEYNPPLYHQDNMTSGAIYTAEQIRRSPK